MCLDPVRRNSLVVCVGGDSFIASSSLIDGCWCNELEIIQKGPAVCTSVNVASEMSNMSTELCRERERKSGFPAIHLNYFSYQLVKFSPLGRLSPLPALL